MSGLSSVVAGLGSGLVAASPVGPAEPVKGVMDGLDDERDEQSLDLIAGERYEGVGFGVAVAFVRADNGEGGMREHGQGDPTGPGRVAADLVFVQCGQALASLEELLYPPSRSSDSHQHGERHGCSRVAAVAGEFAGAAVAADQQLATVGPGVGQVDDGQS